MTRKEKEELARMIATYMKESMDEMWPLERVCENTGLSKSYIYHNAITLGGVKRCGKWFFSRNGIQTFLRQGK